MRGEHTFQSGDTVWYFDRKGIVAGDIWWGPVDHRYFVVFEDETTKECRPTLLSQT